MANRKLKKAAKEYRQRYKDALKERKIELFELLTHLELADPKDNVAFQALIVRSMHALSLNDNDLSLIFGLSRPTVARWKNGINAPHPAMRRAVYKEFANRVFEELNKFILRNK